MKNKGQWTRILLAGPFLSLNRQVGSNPAVAQPAATAGRLERAPTLYAKTAKYITKWEEQAAGAAVALLGV